MDTRYTGRMPARSSHPMTLALQLVSTKIWSLGFGMRKLHLKVHKAGTQLSKVLLRATFKNSAHWVPSGLCAWIENYDNGNVYEHTSRLPELITKPAIWNLFIPPCMVWEHHMLRDPLKSLDSSLSFLSRSKLNQTQIFQLLPSPIQRKAKVHWWVKSGAFDRKFGAYCTNEI